MADLSIGEVARRAGVSASAIRYYEKSGLLPLPPRRAGRRCYDRSVVRRLKLIRALRGCGKSIAELGSWMSVGDGGEGMMGMRRLVEAEIATIENRVQWLNNLKQEFNSKLACDCESLAGCTEI